MTLTQEEKKTIDWYDENAHKWSEKHGMLGDKELMFQLEMDKLFEVLPAGKVLEIGTGHGGDARALIDHYGIENYTGIDAAKGLLEVAKSRNPGANLTVKSVYDLDYPKASFDGFWISAMLIHVHKAKLSQVLTDIHTITKRGGYGFISIMEGDADMIESRPGRHYSLWAQKEFEMELANASFEIVHHRKIETGASPWHTFIVKTS